MIDYLKTHGPTDDMKMHSLVAERFGCSTCQGIDVVGALIDEDLITYSGKDQLLRLGECEEGNCVT